VFELSFLKGAFLSMWKDPAPFLVFNKGYSAPLNNCIAISVLSNFSDALEIIIHEHFSHYFTFKLHPFELGSSF
jgi:hypothetical protein